MMTIRFLLLSMVLWSCAEDKQSLAPELSVSIIISSDSVIIYAGKLKKNTPYQKIGIDEIKVKAILAKEKANAAGQLTALLKLSIESMGGGFMDQVLNLKNWSIESGINNIVFADMDAKDLAVFKLKPVTWAYLDTLFSPHPFNLKMPKEDEGNKDNLPGENTVSMILRSDKDCWCYQGPNYGKGSLYTIEDAMQMIGEKQEELGDSLSVLIKPTKQVTYKTHVDVLDLMNKHSIRNYKIDKLSGVEKIFESTKVYDPPEPVQIKISKSTASQSLPDSSTVIIDIKKDGSVWFSNFTGKNGRYDKVSIKLREPITVELSQFIRSDKSLYSSYERVYIIRGAPNTDYSRFEKVIEALKQNNIYKYKLVTTD